MVLDVLLMMHCYMKQPVVMKMQPIFRMICIDKKLGNKSGR